jgi:hypothetical protein
VATIREHLLLGSELYDTLVTGCGKKPEKIRNGYALGLSLAVRESDYVRLRASTVMHMCGRCEAAWRKICRDRNQKWTPTARARRERGEG